MSSDNTISKVISENGTKIMDAWVAAQEKTRALKILSPEELRRQCSEVLSILQTLESYDPNSPAALRARDHLINVSRTRGLQGFSPTEVATFVFSLKDAILPFMREELQNNPLQLADETAEVNRLIDQLGLATFSAYAESRDTYIREQQKSILELSTPVVEVWEDILALPIIGSVDTARTQQMMESLLTKIVDSGSSVVIIDITGVPVVDTAVAKHLLQTIGAAKLLGAQCILVGISSRIAQTLVHIGVDLSSVITGTTLARGLELALSMTGRKIVKSQG
jgi:rsbT co-antagonist protein RsbR